MVEENCSAHVSKERENEEEGKGKERGREKEGEVKEKNWHERVRVEGAKRQIQSLKLHSHHPPPTRRHLLNFHGIPTIPSNYDPNDELIYSPHDPITLQSATSKHLRLLVGLFKKIQTIMI